MAFAGLYFRVDKAVQYESYYIEASDSFLKYEFWSEGPKGRIRKRVEFVPLEDIATIFNLALSDINKDGDADYTIVSGNNDTKKVLATILVALYDFFFMYPNCSIYIEGNNEARNRLYRMAISNNITELSKDFDFLGQFHRKWELFQGGRAYDAFLIRKKKLNLIIMKKENKQTKSWLAREAEKKTIISERLSSEKDFSPAARKKAEIARKNISVVGLPK